MASIQDFKGIEVSGRTVVGLIQAFGQFRVLASQLLLAEGIGQKGPDGLVEVDGEQWYPADAQLRALARANEQMGDSVVHQVGVTVVKHVQWPESIKDLKTLVMHLDRGYHLSHRRNGRTMWDPKTDVMQEGIGHYRGRTRPDGALELEVDNPYPCAFDKGLLFGAMRMLNVVGAILHDETLQCRKRGGKSCVYVVKG
jgi:hypothetical protein